MKNLKTILRISFGVFLLVYGYLHLFRLTILDCLKNEIFNDSVLIRFASLVEQNKWAISLLDTYFMSTAFLPVVCLIQILAGCFLVTKKFEPFAIAVVFPISVGLYISQISLSTFFYTPYTLIMLLLNVCLLYLYRVKFIMLFHRFFFWL